MRIFIGSSSEQYPITREIRRDLLTKLQSDTIEIVTWKEWFERGANYGLDIWTIITRAIDYFDCAIMLFAGDDRSEIRDNECRSTRDNVLIETGAFAKAKGIENVFLLIDRDDHYHIPSDYRGLNVISFDYGRGADNPGAYNTMSERILQIEKSKIEGIVVPSAPENYKEERMVIQKEKTIIPKERRGKIK